MKKLLNSNTFVHFVFLTLLTSTIYITARLILAPSGSASPEQAIGVRSDYALMLFSVFWGWL